MREISMNPATPAIGTVDEGVAKKIAVEALKRHPPTTQPRMLAILTR
jgi:hypothetical protein